MSTDTTDSSKAAPRRRRVILMRLGLCLFSATLATLGAELVTRVMESVDPSFNRYFFNLLDHGEKLVYDPILGWRNAPGWSNNEANAPITINSHGLRSPEVPYAKPPGVRRILILGDSYTFGYGVGDGDPYVAQLEKILADGATQYEVINTGVNAYGNDQQYLTLARHGMRYDPDIVVLAVFTENDFVDNLRRILDVNAKPAFTNLSLDLTNVPVPFVREVDDKRFLIRPSRLINMSALYRLVFYTAVSRPWAVRTMDTLGLCEIDFEAYQKYQDVRAFEGDPIDLAVAITGGIADECKQQQCPLVVMTFGAFLERRFQGAGTLYRDKLKPKLPDVPLLDLDAEFQKRGFTKQALTEGIGYEHWNPAANKIVADTLHRFLNEQGLLDEPAATPK